MLKRIKRIIVRLKYMNKYAAEKIEQDNWRKRLKEEKNSFFHGNNHVENSFIGKNSYVSHNSIINHCTIGNYCSIGPNVVIGYGDHPYELLTTSPFVYLNDEIIDKNRIDDILKNHFMPVNIKNDVWIGANVYIMNGVTIGNGAVIGAGAVVTRNVEDYEIVLGVPARPIRKRFGEDIIALLLESEWWNLDLIELKDYRQAILNPSKENLNAMINGMRKK